MTVGSLFSGIGGLDLGFEWAGFETKWFCEIEEFPRKVLNKHWPDVPVIEDIRNVTRESVQQVDCIIGGFPCQDISYAGKGAGIDYDLSEQEGTRSGLWWEMWRVIRDLRPRYVIAENVSALTNRGLDTVLGSLAEIGYDAEWQIVSAAAVGSPHIRERIFIVAYPQSVGHGGGSGKERGGPQREVQEAQQGRGSVGSETSGCCGVRGEKDVPDSERLRPSRSGGPVDAECSAAGKNREAGHAFAVDGQKQPDWFTGPRGQPHPVSFKSEMGNAERIRSQGDTRRRSGAKPENRHAQNKRVEVEYDFRGVAYGVSDRVGALKGYGNAVVPQVAYLVARAVREHAEEQGQWLK